MTADNAGSHPHRLRWAIVWFLLGSLSVVVLLAAIYLFAPIIQRRGIMPPRDAASIAELTRRQADLLAADLAKKDADTRALVARMHARQRMDPDATMDFLVLSGGGANGAFGAGLLLGWATVPPGPDALPTFDGVTGVSTGAFIAPFAYIGTDAARERIDRFFRNPQSDWAGLRRPISFYPRNASLMELEGIERDLDRIVDVEFAREIDRATTDGRLLLIQASNIDEQIPGIFDLAEASRRAVETDDARPLREIILASSAIPAVFPPREIDGTLYVDGGAIGNFYAGGRASATRETFGSLWKRSHPDAPIPKTRYWVVLNGALRIAPAVSEPTWPTVAGRAFQLLATSSEITGLRHLYALAELTRLRGDGDVEVRWIAVEKDVGPQDPMSMFDSKAMQSLSDYGRRLGADPASWKTTPP